ncbi:MAG: type II toxin-antitoxin system HipA family toxin YjjJ [Deltaproteobacteria bacterium]|nr:type II toxin-antitoxin system HipA family toxin YjjJ [Deltaproteobacteria bacterium]
MTKLGQDRLLEAIGARPRSTSAELCAALEINRATLTRGVKRSPDRVVVLGRTRRTRYALRRFLRGGSAPVPIFRVDEVGRAHDFGELSLLHPGGSALVFRETCPWPLDGEMRDGWFDGLPYFIYELAPTGYLGRSFARAHAAPLGVPSDPRDWSDDDVLFALSAVGHSQPGDLVLGEAALRRLHAESSSVTWLEGDELERAYLLQAATLVAGGFVGSSAAGEFPKLTAARVQEGRGDHVLVKFSGLGGSPTERRWSDLLVTEHLVLAALPELLGIPAPRSRLLRAGGRTFLEVARFDRIGERGRRPVCSLGSIEAALSGRSVASWVTMARSLGRWLPESEQRKVSLLWWLGTLLFNTDMHAGNLALQPGLLVAPVYDMLPMGFAPNRGGELPSAAPSFPTPLPSERDVVAQAGAAALELWRRFAEDTRISSELRDLCLRARESVESFLDLVA